MPAMAIDEIRRKLETDTRPAVLARLREKAVEAGNAGCKVEAKLVTTDQTVAEGSREVVGAVSAETPDEAGDVILVGGWDLSYYRKHPVVMGFHDYFTYPTGKCLWIKQDKGSGRLLAKTQYATRPDTWPREQEWPPDTILALRQQDVMRGYSVGFVILEERMPTEKEIKAHPEWEGTRIIARAKLLEYSDVPLPCHADAAQIMVAKGLLPKQEADDGADTEPATADPDGATDAGELDGERGVPADPDGAVAGDAGDGNPDPDGVAHADGQVEQVLGAAPLADPDGVETKPSAENHACEINDGEYTRYRSEKRDSNGKPYTVRYGVRASDGETEEVTYFYPVADWTASQARSHCKGHDGTFAAATGAEAVACEVPSGPSPAEVAHMRVLQEIEDGKYVMLDEKAIARAALEKAVARQMAYHRGHLG